MKHFEKSEVGLIIGCAVAGVIFMLFVTKGGILFSLALGTICGAAGGGVACLFRRWRARQPDIKQEEQTTEQPVGQVPSESAPDGTSSEAPST